MNDRFKFRLWHNGDKKYHDADYTSAELGQDGRLRQYGNLEDDEEYTIEQCTGLKDRNGKLIFEGDVLSFNGFRDPVYFDDGSFVILHDGSVFVPIKQKYTDVFEIIGNIHEMEVEK